VACVHRTPRVRREKPALINDYRVEESASSMGLGEFLPRRGTTIWSGQWRRLPISTGLLNSAQAYEKDCCIHRYVAGRPSQTHWKRPYLDMGAYHGVTPGNGGRSKSLYRGIDISLDVDVVVLTCHTYNEHNCPAGLIGLAVPEHSKAVLS